MEVSTTTLVELTSSNDMPSFVTDNCNNFISPSTKTFTWRVS